VFKGREAKQNRAIFKVLSNDSPLTIYDLHKRITSTKGFKTLRYGNVNTRVKALEKEGYVRKIGTKNTKAGFKASLYEATSKALFALLINSLDLDDLILELDEISTITILSTIVTRN
jgi:DNA-binding PadR family transcriptional regulator